MNQQTQSSNVFVRILRAIWRGLDSVRKVVHLFLMLFVLMIFVGSLSGGAPSIPGSAVLSLQPSGALVEELAGDAFDRALAELMDNGTPQTLVSDLVDALAYAKTDDRIKGVHLNLASFGGGSLPKLEIVADAIRDFQESGKPVIATADFYSQGSYYLAAHADELYMNPEGIIFMMGYGAYRPYFSEAIENLMIDWNIFRVGSYKSAVEPFMRMDMSDESREATGSIVSQLWDGYLLDVESARGLEAGTVRDMVDNLAELSAENNGDISQVVLDLGLVDELKTRTEVRERLIELAGPDREVEDTFSSVDSGTYLSQMRMLKPAEQKDDNVAVVIASGTIMDGSQPPGQIGGDSTSELLRRALRDESVKAVVLRVDSGGGSKFASEVISDSVSALIDAGKPVVASMSGVAASGGYWIAAKTDRIVASPMTITGSIGIFGMLPTYQRTAAYLGINVDGVGTTPLAGQLRSDRAMSDEAKQLYQSFINDGYDDFLEQVASGRDMTTEAVNEVGQGRIWTGLDALNHGLVDELGNLDDAIAAAAEAAGLEDGSYGSFVVKTELSPTEQLLVDMLGGAKMLGLDPAVFVDKPGTLEKLALQFEAMVDPLMKFDDPMGIYAYCFCEAE